MGSETLYQDDARREESKKTDDGSEQKIRERENIFQIGSSCLTIVWTSSRLNSPIYTNRQHFRRIGIRRGKFFLDWLKFHRIFLWNRNWKGAIAIVARFSYPRALILFRSSSWMREWKDVIGLMVQKFLIRFLFLAFFALGLVTGILNNKTFLVVAFSEDFSRRDLFAIARNNLCKLTIRFTWLSGTRCEMEGANGFF